MHSFNPELLGSLASKGIVTMFLEVLFVRSGLYFFENTVEVSVLDIIAYCAYLFVPYALPPSRPWTAWHTLHVHTRTYHAATQNAHSMCA